MALPPCGLYRTTRLVAGLPAGRLVYFHNHGDPGAGVYPPLRWEMNRAIWSDRGQTLADDGEATGLEPLLPEGLYSVTTPFTCCERGCVRYRQSQLVQLGYDGAATPLLFVPELSRHGLAFPERGNRLEPAQLRNLERLEVATGSDAPVQRLLVH